MLINTEHMNGESEISKLQLIGSGYDLLYIQIFGNILCYLHKNAVFLCFKKMYVFFAVRKVIHWIICNENM